MTNSKKHCCIMLMNDGDKPFYMHTELLIDEK